MRKITIPFSIFISLIVFSTSSLSEWKLVTTSDIGDQFYVDKNGIERKSDDYHYFWYLVNLKKPITKFRSTKFYLKVDCDLFKYKPVELILFEDQMGKGKSFRTPKYINDREDWKTSNPSSSIHEIMIRVCLNEKI